MRETHYDVHFILIARTVQHRAECGGGISDGGSCEQSIAPNSQVAIETPGRLAML